MRITKKIRRSEAGIALVTTILLMLLMSSMLVGFIMLITEGQKLSGINSDYSKAFYGAEAGMEKLTADLGNLFNKTYSPSTAQLSAISNLTNAPTINGVLYTKFDGTSGYSLSYPVDGAGNPLATVKQITSGSSKYQGMTALITPYTLTVTARTNQGTEVKLQRTTQTVGIPMFQFGVYSDSDLSFFPGPNFNFGGRTHTNGNLFLATGATLSLSDRVTAVKDVIRTNLSNGYSTSSAYAGTVNVITSPCDPTLAPCSYRPLAQSEGSLVATLGSGVNPVWNNLSLGASNYAGNIVNGATGAKTLDLGITTLGTNTKPIDLIRRPPPGDDPAVLAERYFAQASIRVLLSDNPQDITQLTPCIDSSTAPFDLSRLAQPVANWPTTPATDPVVQLKAKMDANNVAGYSTLAVPLAASGATATALGGGGITYNPTDGYWQPSPTDQSSSTRASAPLINYSQNAGLPIIKGFIKIEVQRAPYGNPCGSWKDVTIEVLGYGYAGRNTYPTPDPSTGGAGTQLTKQAAPPTNWAATNVSFTPGSSSFPGAYNILNAPLNTPAVIPPLNPLPDPSKVTVTQVGPSNCPDVHPNAIIRLERVRDNPSTYSAPAAPYYVGPCGVTVDAATGKIVTAAPPWPTDYWPNALFDTREGTVRDIPPAGSIGAGVTSKNYAQMVTLGGVMQYVEVDTRNLARYLTGALPGSGSLSFDTVTAPNNYVLYVSDRRGNYLNQTFAPGTVPNSPMGKETGEYGFQNFINSGSQFGCPDSTVETAENLAGLTGPPMQTYGQDATQASQPYQVGALPPGSNPLGNGYYPDNTSGSPAANAVATALGGTVVTKAIAPNPNCTTVTSPTVIWPMSMVIHANEARQNPNFFFRRAVKIVNGSTVGNLMNMCPGNVVCGLTIAAENPVYIQGDFNANSANGGFNDPSVAASVLGDAVTLLSKNWNDVNSFIAPFNQNTARNGVTTYYRTAIVGGKGLSFQQPGGYTTNQDFGTDGGVHNFLRFLENWGGQTLNYRGSIISLYTNRQATGVFKCCTTVYGAPTRGYNFDTDFLQPQLLPPRTPLFRDINTTGFTQLLLTTQQ